MIDPVEIIVPIYNAVGHVRDCLDALLRHLPEEATVQLVDDASTDAAISDLLAEHPIRGVDRVALHVNARNQGFVATVNAAIARTTTDVVLLNSDTRVTSGWLQRLQRCALSTPEVASVTPWSNNAEICSLPEFCKANRVPADIDALADAIAAAGQPTYPRLPTAIGFCMYIRRAAWVIAGEFDVATFGRGYGEENDWCLRASELGFLHLLCDDAYVAHVGGASFADTGHRPGGEQLRRLLERYPHYNDLIASFIQSDPLAPRRQAIASDPRVVQALSR